MANANVPNGAKPFQELKNIGIYIAAGTIYPGDFVKFDPGTSSTTARRAQVVVAAATNGLCGVALNYATAGQIIRVADDPAQLFILQASGSEIDNQVDLGLNCSIVATAGSSTYKQSRHALDSSTIATTIGLELKLVGMVDRADDKNEMGAYVNCIVKINVHQLAGALTGTTGI